MDEADPKARVAAFLDRFGKERNVTLPPLSAEGVGSIQRGSAVVTIHVLAERGVLLLLARVATASQIERSETGGGDPDGFAGGAGVRAPRGIDAALGRRLLTASFTETGDAAFALHPETGDLYLRILRGLDGLDYEEFEDLVHSIARSADHWDDRFA